MNQELIQMSDWYKTSGSGTFEKTANGLVITGGTTWIYTTDYIPLPTGSNITYEYDFDISVTANNQVYIQIERFNVNKGTISNNAATNCVGGYKPTSDVNHVRYKGTISLATFDNPAQTTAYIRVRACTGYSGTTGTHIIHSWSLRAISDTTKTPSIQKNGELITEHLREHYTDASFGKDGFVYGNNFYEY